MNCVGCGRENPAGASFCIGCGSALGDSCTNCSAALPPDARFCPACGRDQLPEKASDKTDADSHLGEGERRQATVLFSDLCGYTEMGERLDPEEVEEVLRRIRSEAEIIVERHGGIVNQYVGDEVLALFGLPQAHENDPRLATRAAIELHEAVRRIAAELEPRLERPLRLHTGISSGLLVAQPRDSAEGKYGITGDVVNTGARIVGLAEPDEILLGPETASLVSAFFETEPLDPVNVKGKKEPIVPHRVIGERAVRSRFDAAEKRGLSTYVGRQRELATLMESLGRAAVGEGQVVSLIGDAGLGKSRLIYELRKKLAPEDANIAIGRCSATGEHLPYLPFTDLVGRWLSIGETDSPEEIRDKAHHGMLALSSDLQEHLPAVFHLLSIPVDVVPEQHRLPAGIAAEAVRRKIFEALKACLLAGCRERPLVMIIEDLHWIDEVSESLIQQYIEAIPAQRVLLLLSYRPEYRPGWGHYSHLTQLGLRPLEASATSRVLASALGTDSVSDELCEVVQRATGGNPFFTEEVGLSLLEQRLVSSDRSVATFTRPVTEIELPDTVQAVVRARIDRLDEAPRNTLRLASVVGREFTERLVTRLSDLDEATSQHLAELRTLEMILEKSFHPELEFMFKHAITHEVAYESLLVRRRKALHRLTAMAIEELYADRLSEYCEMLAHHFDQGEVWDKATQYLVRAGQKALGNHAINTALRHFERAQEIVEHHTPELPWMLHFDLSLGRSGALGASGLWVYSLEVLQRAIALANSEADSEALVEAYSAAIPTAFWAHDLTSMKDYLTSLRALVASDPDTMLLVESYQLLESFFSEELEPAVSSFARTMDHFHQRRDSIHAITATHALSLFYRWRGDYQQGRELLEWALPRMKDIAAPPVYMDCVFFFGLILGEQGHYQQGLQVLEDGLEWAEAAGVHYSVPKLVNSMGWAHQELCLPERALSFNEQSLTLARDMTGPGTTNLFEMESQTLLNLAENRLLAGDLEAARTHLETVYENAKSPEYFFVRARWLARCMLGLGELWLELDQPERTKRFLEELHRHGWTQRFPYRRLQIRAAVLQARLDTRLDRYDDAEALLARTAVAGEELGNPTQLRHIHTAWGDLCRQRGRRQDARGHYQRALEVVEHIASGLTDRELERGYLQSPAIERIRRGAADG